MQTELARLPITSIIELRRKDQLTFTLYIYEWKGNTYIDNEVRAGTGT